MFAWAIIVENKTDQPAVNFNGAEFQWFHRPDSMDVASLDCTIIMTIKINSLWDVKPCQIFTDAKFH